MTFFKKIFGDPQLSLNEIDPYQLFQAESLVSFLPFLSYLKVIERELKEDYFLLLFTKSKLPEISKIALAITIIYNSDILLSSSIGSLFAYFHFQLSQNKYLYREEVRLMIIHCLDLFFPKDYYGKNLQSAMRKDLKPIIPTSSFTEANSEMEKLILKAFTSSGPDFKRKIKKFLPLLRPHNKMLYSKKTAKDFLKIFVFLFPDSPILLLLLLNTPNSAFTVDYRQSWITSIIDNAIDYLPSSKTKFEFIERLKDLFEASQYQIRLSAFITAWTLTDDITPIKVGTNDNVKYVRKRCQNILKNPEREKNRRMKKHQSELKKISHYFLESKPDISFITGTIDSVFVFEVKLGLTSRTVALKGEQTLDDLHGFIQEVFKWDNDHLYAFFMNNRAWSKIQHYFSPDNLEGPFAHKKSLYSLNLYVNKKFLYLFDFGDNHEFRILVKQITSEEEINGPFPLLLSQKGKSPQQYHYYE